MPPSDGYFRIKAHADDDLICVEGVGHIGAEHPDGDVVAGPHRERGGGLGAEVERELGVVLHIARAEAHAHVCKEGSVIRCHPSNAL